MERRLDKTGAHIFMSPEEIEKWAAVLRSEHSDFLQKYGVQLPSPGSLSYYWLVYLRKYKGLQVHKDTIAAFVASVKPDAGRDQQVRHLAARGWYILNKGDKLPDVEETMSSGYHMLVTTEAPKPTFLFRALKRSGRMAAKNFGELKAVYDFRCATCGSQEGKPHFIEPDKRTILQQGHMDPFVPLGLNNTIPQCQICNQVYQDRYVFDAKGRVAAVASIDPVRAAKPHVQEQIRKFLGGS